MGMTHYACMDDEYENLIVILYTLVCRCVSLELQNRQLFYKDRTGLLTQELPKGPMNTPRLLGHKRISISFLNFQA